MSMLDELKRLPMLHQQHVVGSVYDGAVNALVDLLCADVDQANAHVLYAVYQALATAKTRTLHKTLSETGPDDEQPIKAEISRRLARVRDLQTVEAQQAEMARCAQSPAHWITNWGWTRDPERSGLRTIPFVPFQRQLELIEWVLELQDTGKSGYLNKARKVGASYIVAFIATHQFLFRGAVTVILSSYRKDALHKQNQPDECIIEKIRVILRLLPTWMIPEGYNEADHFNFCSVINPANGSTIVGILPLNDNLRSTRGSIAFLDEFPLYVDAKNAFTILEDVTPCRICLGTPMPGTYSVQLMRTIPTFTFPWTDDPRKPRDFKERWLSAGDKTEADFAREHECSTDIAGEQTLIAPEWIDAAMNIELEAAGEVVCGLDPAGLGGDEIAFCRRVGPVATFDVWRSVELTVTSERAMGLGRQYGASCLYFDASGLGVGVRDHFSEAAPAFDWHPIFAQLPADGVFVGDDTELATERYADQTTMLWFELRARLQRTHRHVTGVQLYPHDDLIKLPKDDLLREQLLSRKWQWWSGKIKLEPKQKLRHSPDRADALTLTMSTHIQRTRNRRRLPVAREIDLDRVMGGKTEIPF